MLEDHGDGYRRISVKRDGNRCGIGGETEITAVCLGNLRAVLTDKDELSAVFSSACDGFALEINGKLCASDLVYYLLGSCYYDIGNFADIKGVFA